MIKYVPKSASDLGLADQFKFGYIGYDLSKDNKECGKCISRIDRYTMDILSVDSDEDDETIEGFIRSALNFGANRSVYIAYYKAEKGINVAKTLGFKENDDGVLEGEIPYLLQGSCCKDKR